MRSCAAIAPLLLGCYEAIAPYGVPCGPGDACPGDQVCDHGREPAMCVAELSPDPTPLCGDTSGLPPEAPWPLIYGCPTNVGRTSHFGPATGETAIPPFGVDKSKRGVVIGTNNQIVFRENSAGVTKLFDCATGAETWSYAEAKGTGIEPMAAIDRDGVVYATTNYGKLFAIDLATGGERWQIQLAGAYSAPILGAPGMLYFGSNGPWGFYGVDTVAHKQKWHFDVPDEGDAATAPALDLGRGTVYFVDTKLSRLFALDAMTGALQYSVPISGAAVGSPVLGPELLYVATATAGIAAFEPRTGALRWQQPAGASVVQPALLANGDLVSSTTAGDAFILDRATGEQLDAFPLEANVIAPPVIDRGDTIYFATETRTIAWSTAPRGLRWESPLVGRIVVADHAVIVLPRTSTLAVIGP